MNEWRIVRNDQQASQASWEPSLAEVSSRGEVYSAERYELAHPERGGAIGQGILRP